MEKRKVLMDGDSDHDDDDKWESVRMSAEGGCVSKLQTGELQMYAITLGLVQGFF